MAMMRANHFVKAERDKSLFNKSTTPQVHKTITAQMMIIARISKKKDI